MSLYLTQYDTFTQAASSAQDQPLRTYQALESLANELIGAKLFTIMTIDPESGEASRSYSNMPDAYPISGKKPVDTTDWSTQVIERHETFVANNIDEIAAVFDDYELIQSLGCESVVNVPIIVAGEVLGTLNCLDVAGHYTPERVQACEQLKLPGAMALLTEIVAHNVANNQE